MSRESEDLMAQPIAFVLLDRHVVPDMNAVAAAIRARHPDVPVEVAAAGEAGQAAGSPLISCAGQMVVVMSIPWRRSASAMSGSMCSSR